MKSFYYPQPRLIFRLLPVAVLLLFACKTPPSTPEDNPYPDAKFINQPGDGFRGIWYMNQPVGEPYQFKYSGGMGTYCAKHRPFSIYASQVNKTFFCFGGTTQDSWKKFDLTISRDRDTLEGMLLHMVSFYDHNTGEVARPTIILDKMTSDAHDNPVISIDDKGYIWIFSTSHGTSRRSYIHKSISPFDISGFEQVHAQKLENGILVPMDNFSYFQIWNTGRQGFMGFFTHYEKDKTSGMGQRVAYFVTSKNGVEWSEWQKLAAISEGHYQISEYNPEFHTAGTAFNYHPDQPKPGEAGLNYRTNLYYIQTGDFGKSWQAMDGAKVQIPLTEAKNPALVYDFESEGLKVYMKDLTYDENGYPVILFLTSTGYQPGPENGPYTWRIARWNGLSWAIFTVTNSDHNYDMGSLFIEPDAWRIIAPTDTGAQAYNPGGEMVEWISNDRGEHWRREHTLTQNSLYNHTYARRTIYAQPGFYAFWADGHGRQPSNSRFYFSDKAGNVYQLPEKMETDTQKPIRISPRN
ncbi:MAG: BNR-4 repeat-containing protein [Bacteroidia bacterium]